ncbi:MAG: hypothetical protein BRD57_00730 [Proteobacteria bacterium SW_6_67_9]|nr:MAG: hypothetical protein BRD57_00730 [Proteobacteria bacterium SW_6_67_9]
MARAIRSLGAIEPAQPIVVGGPPEIRGLGEELERLRLRLERSEAEKARFLRHMSHELKTPLAAIREGTELLADGSVTADSDDHREIVEILQRSSVELQQLIENLLVLSARDRAHALERIDRAEVLREALQRHEVTRLRRGLVVDWRVEAVSFDGLRPLVQSALSNLIGNAVHFSPTGGTLHLRGFGRGDRVVIEVADDGPGIPADDRPHVFEPFAQGRHAGTASTRGTGIGLSVVRDCARAHDGYVEIVDGGFAGAHIRMVLYARPASATQEGA